MKIYKNGKLLGPEIEGLFKAVAKPARKGGVTYTVESYDGKESWRVEFSREDVSRIRGGRSRPPKEETYAELQAKLKQAMEVLGKGDRW